MGLDLETVLYILISVISGIGGGVVSFVFQNYINKRGEAKENHINRIKNDIFIPWSKSSLSVEDYGRGAEIRLSDTENVIGDNISYEIFKEEREFPWAEQHLRAYPEIFSHWTKALELLPKIDNHVKTTRKSLMKELKSEMKENFPFLKLVEYEPKEENTYSSIYIFDKIFYEIKNRASDDYIEKDSEKRFKKYKDIITLDGTDIIKSSEFDDDHLNNFISVFNRISTDDEFINKIKLTEKMKQEINKELGAFNQGLSSLIKDIEDYKKLKGRCEECSLLFKIKKKFANSK